MTKKNASWGSGYFQGVSFKNNQTTLPFLNVKTIVDSSGELFYNYGGSLTMPPCDEDVNWIIMTRILPLKKSEFRQFFSIGT